MKISISAKLFFGFLVVIFLNVFFVVVVSKLTDLNSIVNILRHQNEAKNGLLRIAKQHGNQRTSFIIYENLRKQQSIDNFNETARDIKSIMDSMSIHMNVILTTDSLVSPTSLHDERRKRLLILSGAVSNRISKFFATYTGSFKSFVDLNSLKPTKKTPAQRTALKKLIEESSDSLTTELKAIEAMLDDQTVGRIKEIETRLDNVKKITMIILAGMSIFAFGFGLVFSRAMTNSLRRLKESAIAIAKGDFNFNPQGYPNDEIGDLASAFFDMATDLKNAQEELVKSKRLAAIGEVVASVNHEINNPLMIISGNAQFLEMSMEEGFPRDFRDRVKAIIDETERISQVTRKLREIRNPIVEDYTSSGEQMINLDKSST